jgi:hypothetical protein
VYIKLAYFEDEPMAVAVLPVEVARDTRLTALVSAPEAEQIARRASEAGLSVSAYLRDRALGLSAEPDEAAALRQIDALIDRMEADMDRAVADLAATLVRMDKAG